MPKPKLLKQETRHWSSGYVRLALIGIEGHSEDNYISLEKRHSSKNLPHPEQRFNLRERDWKALKRLIDGVGNDEFGGQSGWAPPVLTDEQLASLIGTRPELLEVVLKAPNLGELSEPSLQALDRLSARIGELQFDQIELIFDRLAGSTGQAIADFSNLLRDLELEQVTALSRLVHQKLKTLDLLERVVADPERSERAVHEILDRNPWMLGSRYEIVQSDRTLATYLADEAPDDPVSRRRPDLIVKRTPHSDEILLIELKAPGVKLSAAHIGQVLSYRGVIERARPNLTQIDCFVIGYEKDITFTESRDAALMTFGELVNALRDELSEFERALRKNGASGVEDGDTPQDADFDLEVSQQDEDDDIPW